MATLAHEYIWVPLGKGIQRESPDPPLVWAEGRSQNQVSGKVVCQCLPSGSGPGKGCHWERTDVSTGQELKEVLCRSSRGGQAAKEIGMSRER